MFTPVARQRAGHTALGVLLLLFVASCAPTHRERPICRVRGQLYVQGRPAPGAIVLFHPLTWTDDTLGKPRGEVDEQGEFRLNTYRTGDGAPAGAYAVTVLWEPFAKQAERSESILEPPHGPDRLGYRYADPKTTELHCTIRAGRNDVIFRLP